MALQYYAYVNSAHVVKQPTIVKQPEEVVEHLPLLADAVDITLAQYDPATIGHITAHNIKDYRRKQFTMTLLPKVHTMFDTLLEGGEYWRVKLSNASTYTG